MNSFEGTSHYYVDIRTKHSSEEISFDLAQHLPRRLQAGPVLVITDNPQVFLSVIRKRLARLTDDLTRENARTLDRFKKEGLEYEIARLNSTAFTARGTFRARSKAYVCFAKPTDVTNITAAYATIYVTLSPLKMTFQHLLQKLNPGGLLVTYGTWNESYEQLLGARLRS